MICDKTGKEYTRPQTKGLETHQFEFDTQMTRVFASTVSSELVSVQPMSAPVGNLFYFDHVYVDSEDDENTNEI